jgi:uncharacterized protein YneF (UPF0154 family)
MPKKKAESLLNNKKDNNPTEPGQLIKELKSNESSISRAESDDVNIKEKAEKLSDRILRVLYATYGAKDSHTNKLLYQHVMFEVAYLSNKTIEEVMQKWPKFDIFAISGKIKKIVEEELRSNPTIMYQMIMNDRIVADRILAKAIVDSIAS